MKWWLAGTVGVVWVLSPGGAVWAQNEGDNLLANPGFESLAADKPARWDHFIQPKPGAVARLDDQAHGGAYSVWLHTPSPYEKEPVNNWSQNIIAALGGETVQVSGYIKVSEAKEAALWLQCWRKQPWGVLGTFSTSTATPVYGTTDWQHVSMEAAIPEGTDFVTLRCVLLGTGSAWFDDIAVSRLTTEPTVESTEALAITKDGESEAPAATVPDPPADTENIPLVLLGESMEPSAPPTDESVRQEATVMPVFTRLESEIERLREANHLLTDTLQQIQKVNEGLVKEIMSMQEDLQTIREDKKRIAAPPLETNLPRVPPLIPLSEAQETASP